MISDTIVSNQLSFALSADCFDGLLRGSTVSTTEDQAFISASLTWIPVIATELISRFFSFSSLPRNSALYSQTYYIRNWENFSYQVKIQFFCLPGSISQAPCSDRCIAYHSPIVKLNFIQKGLFNFLCPPSPPHFLTFVHYFFSTPIHINTT